MEATIPIILAAIGILPATIAAIAGLILGLKQRKKLEIIHIELNSRLTELLESKGKEQRSEGIAEGRRNLRKEQKEEKDK